MKLFKRDRTATHTHEPFSFAWCAELARFTFTWRADLARWGIREDTDMSHAHALIAASMAECNECMIFHGDKTAKQTVATVNLLGVAYTWAQQHRRDTPLTDDDNAIFRKKSAELLPYIEEKNIEPLFGAVLKARKNIRLEFLEDALCAMRLPADARWDPPLAGTEPPWISDLKNEPAYPEKEEVHNRYLNETYALGLERTRRQEQENGATPSTDQGPQPQPKPPSRLATLWKKTTNALEALAQQETKTATPLPADATYPPDPPTPQPDPPPTPEPTRPAPPPTAPNEPHAGPPPLPSPQGDRQGPPPPHRPNGTTPFSPPQEGRPAPPSLPAAPSGPPAEARPAPAPIPEEAPTPRPKAEKVPASSAPSEPSWEWLQESIPAPAQGTIKSRLWELLWEHQGDTVAIQTAWKAEHGGQPAPPDLYKYAKAWAREITCVLLTRWRPEQVRRMLDELGVHLTAGMAKAVDQTIARWQEEHGEKECDAVA